MARTTNLNLPEIEQFQTNGDVTHNEGLWITDLHGQAIVEALQTAEPASPSEGQAWIINGTPTGSNWGTGALANQVAHFYGGVWQYYTPRQGWSFFAKSDTLVWQYDGISWIVYIAGDTPPNQTWQAFQDYDTPLTTPSFTSGTWNDIVISNNVQIGTDFSYNPSTGELTYSGVNALIECSFSIRVGGGVANNTNYSARIFDSTNTKIIVLGTEYVTSNQVTTITINGNLLRSMNNGDVIRLQLNPSNTATFDISGGWFVYKMYNV